MKQQKLPPSFSLPSLPQPLSPCSLIDGVFLVGEVEVGAEGVAAEVQSQSGRSPPSQEGDEIIL